ncbi:MAG: hypothetical protein K6E12_07345 [Saccharofermentans sp.]|nr:hypothetical protein [Saccharofermentans sp.]
MNQLISQLEIRKAELLKMRNEALMRLKKLRYKGTPNYRIRIDSKKNQIFIKEAGKAQKYLKTSKTMIAEQVATYDYLKFVLKKIESELKQIEKTIALCNKTTPESYYESLNKARQKLIVPLVPTDSQFVSEWLSQPYTGGRFENDESEFYTDKNERVRSKSEILIANALAKNSIPYKYECPLTLIGLGRIHPDFTVLNVKRRKVMYWEHLGKMDDADYARKNTFRINCYEKNGYLPGDSLITTWETSTMPIDVKLVDQIIRRYLLD